jgi:acyl CoA:acetate/3-ketoacid CoA transferase beta subunit
MIGFRPVEGDPYLFNRANAASALFHSGFVQTLGVMAGPAARRCLALLAAAQIDGRGNINSSRTSDGRFIVGSGGANDLGSGGATCLVVMPLKKGRFAETLPFTTTPVRRLRAAATDLCLLERNRDGRLQVTGVMCELGTEDATRAEIASRCGDDLPVSSDLARFDPPSDEELELLRSFDPQRAILA